jgi:cation:H+ antiporter
MMILWIGFILCTSVIVYAGMRLARYGNIIAEKAGIGKTWIAILNYTLNAFFVIIGAIDFAIGHLFGSNIF